MAAPLPTIPEAENMPAVSAQNSPTPPSPRTPSPKAMSIVQSPGQASNTSRMSVDPAIPPPGVAAPSEISSQLYDVANGVLTTWGFLINRRLKALICMSCCCMVLPSSLPSHLVRQHPGAHIPFNKHTLEEIVEQEGLLSDWPALPLPDVLEYEGLERRWGFKCPQCPAMYSNDKSITVHAISEHKTRYESEEFGKAWMQRFSQHHQGKTWFSVTPRSVQLHSPSADYLLAVRQELDARPALSVSDVDHRHISPWHITTRWLEYLEGRDPRVMQALIQVPKDGEPLFFLVAGVRHYMEAAYNLIQQSSEVCLQILNTDTQIEDYNHHPFGRHQLDDTLRAYIRLVLQLLCFVLRAEADLNLPTEVRACLTALSQCDSHNSDDLTLAIHELLLSLWTREWTPSQANQFPDPTLQFVIHTQVNGDRSLKKPEDVTGIFAKLVYGMRLTFLYECHQRLQAEPHPSLVVSIRALRPWFTKGYESTFHTLRSLQHRASSIVMSTQNEPNMVWKDKTGFTTLIYLGHEISLNGLRKCQRAMEDATISLLTDTLLFGHPFSIDITRLKDDMGNKSPGYSLFSDRVNQDILGPVDQLADYILKTPALRQHFVLFVRDGKVVWNAMAMSAWLNTFARLNLLCLVQAEMNCGAPGRTTELTAMPTANTLGGMLRALRIIDNHVVLMRTYHKMHAAQGLDRVIPHSLNAALAAIFIYKEAICRPFAQLCASVLYPGDARVKSLYQDFLFINYDKPFIGDDLSAEMKVWTGKHMGIELGIQKWRQCSTPLRRKHAGLEEMWLEDQDTVDAAQAGHSHRVDHLRYGVTDLSATGMAEDYIGPFLKTSVMWHKVLHLVPGGQLLSLDAARYKHFRAGPVHQGNAVHTGLDTAAVIQALKAELEPRLSSIEQRLEAVATKHDITSIFKELKDMLARPQDAAPAHPPPAPAQRPATLEDHSEGLYYDPPEQEPVHSEPPQLAAPPAMSAEQTLPTEAEALQALRQVLKKPDAQWSNEGQKLAVMSGLEWKKDTVVILPTGSGKSAVIATIAFLEKLKVTAVLCPLRSLLGDWKRRLTALQLPFEVFDPQKATISGQASIVLVSLDVTPGAAWRQAVRSMRPEIKLNRYVVDEAHLIITESSYREVMHRVKELREIPTQLFLLSATIPPAALSPLRDMFNLADGDNTRIIRAALG
ncbi:hypothetical protein GY45DRAFT_1349651 [Cubamyces sp. BRFM 1775]|nr:hypothetical protein GY45DRAFT_1349651 [Cubamyces sp. BRFM 1775]